MNIAHAAPTLAVLLPLLLQAPAAEEETRAALHAACVDNRYQDGLAAAIALRDAGVDPWGIEEWTALVGRAAEGGSVEDQAALFAGILDAFPDRRTPGVLLHAALACARTGVRTHDAPRWLEELVDGWRAQADALEPGLDRTRREAEWSMFRSYLAFVYDRCGERENRLAAEEGEPGATFEEAAEAAGIAGAPGKRVAAGDFDGDGFDDLLFRGALYRNRGDGTFEDVTAAVGLPGAAASSALLVDMDGDDRPDVVLANRGGISVWRQTADRTFQQVSQDPPTGPFPADPEGLGAGDLDGDGRPDIYAAIYEEPFPEGHPDRVFRNRGDGTLEDVTEPWGFHCDPPRPGRGVAMADFDDDGDLDVYVANYRLVPNYLWRNRARDPGDGGVPPFQDDAAALGVAGTEDQGYYGHSIGAAWGDIDGDLDLDLVVGNLAHPRFIEFSDMTYVFRNLGDRFEDTFASSGIRYEETHSDVSLADYDDDGDLDLYLTSIYAERPSFLYQNDGTGCFVPVTWRAGAVVFDGWGHAWLDAEGDGDLDLVVCGDRVRLLRNRGSGNAWVAFRLPPSAVGARVTLAAGDRRQIREIAAGRGTSSQDSAVCHFGLGPFDGRVSVTVRWPDGRATELSGLDSRRVHDIARPR